MNKKMLSLAGALFASAILGPAALATTAEQLVQHNCAACHRASGDPQAGLSRMQEQRKTPEGWYMTLSRMQTLHKAVYSDPDGDSSEDVMRRLVKHFADTQGLAPAESAPYRYILEQRHNTIHVPEDAEYAVMCSRCHSEARVGLQRRSEEEWRLLVHFHLGQFPTTEYQAGGRDRDWLGTALERTVPMLAKTYSFESAEWSAWQKAAKPQLAGNWRLMGHQPGRGDFDAQMKATATTGDGFDLVLKGQYSDGESFSGSGRASVFTGYEWRATLEINGTSYQQVLAASEDGSELSGRIFENDRVEIGADLRAWKEDGKARLLAVSPAYLRRGASQTITLVGSQLQGKPDFGQGVRVDSIAGSDSGRMVIKVTAAADAAIGARAVRVGDSALAASLTVYAQVDRVEVTPAYAVGRVGGNGGSQAAVRSTHEALGWSNGADGQPGTEDDLRIGVMPAQWSVAPWDQKADSDGDVRFAGTMDKDSGVFTPAAAGPNPDRKYQTNNAGNLKVIASVADGERSVQGEAHLLVTVQRWNNPPIL